MISRVILRTMHDTRLIKSKCGSISTTLRKSCCDVKAAINTSPIIVLPHKITTIHSVDLQTYHFNILLHTLTYMDATHNCRLTYRCLLCKCLRGTRVRTFRCNKSFCKRHTLSFLLLCKTTSIQNHCSS